MLRANGHYVATAQADLSAGGAPVQLSPGGDFGWLKKNYRWRNEAGEMETSSGDSHGHNIVAIDFGYSRDGRHAVSPGGQYPSASLSCTSCHDPHGNYRRNQDGSISSSGVKIVSSGSYKNSPAPDATKAVGTYRMLAGKGYLPKSALGGEPFRTDPPVAVSPENYNRSEAGSDTRVAYGSGMSEWCQNCHSGIHSSGGSQHVAGNNAKFSDQIVANYNSYVKSGDLNGSQATSYTSLVPYEMGTDDYSVLKMTANSDGSVTSGPGGMGDRPNVSCLSCHRGHASGWDSMTRWNTEATMMVGNGSYAGIDSRASSVTAQGRTEAEARQAYYGRPASRFAIFQRSLCNKCHAKD
ncbi:cytochrome C [Geomonas agri]|uniref:cytochrome C n=1 Tax=Geomonas agri TaxID=2873702 RepID=UPI00296F56F1|nr:cytochrome C [Geomonas agri]